MSTEFKLVIEMDNAAFEEDQGRPELVRLLKLVAAQVEGFKDGTSLRDVNGNTVGHWSIRTIVFSPVCRRCKHPKDNHSYEGEQLGWQRCRHHNCECGWYVLPKGSAP